MKKKLLIALALLAVRSVAQTNVSAPIVTDASTQGLPRLSGKSADAANGASKKAVAATLTALAYNVDDLAPAAGSTKSKRGDIDYLAIDGGQSWTRNLRGSGKTVQFVTLTIHASPSTIVHCGNAWIGVLEEERGRYVQLMAGKAGTGGIDWTPLNVHLPLASYGGKLMAALQTVTVRLDPDANTWDLFVGARVVASRRPFYASPRKQEDKEVGVLAGASGAWVIGLVQSDDNPLFEDSNRNGIDDKFETDKKGKLVAENASASEKNALANDWAQYQWTHPVVGLNAKRMLPDRLLKPGP